MAVFRVKKAEKAHHEAGKKPRSKTGLAEAILARFRRGLKGVTGHSTEKTNKKTRRA